MGGSPAWPSSPGSEAGHRQGKPRFHWKWQEWVALAHSSLSRRPSPKMGQVDMTYSKGSTGGGRYTQLYLSLLLFAAAP